MQRGCGNGSRGRGRMSTTQCGSGMERALAQVLARTGSTSAGADLGIGTVLDMPLGDCRCTRKVTRAYRRRAQFESIQALDYDAAHKAVGSPFPYVEPVTCPKAIYGPQHNIPSARHERVLCSMYNTDPFQRLILKSR